MGKRFCCSQIQCSDKPKGIYSCMAHLNESRVPDCSFAESDICLESYEDSNRKKHYEFKIRFNVPENSAGDGVCRDFRILPDIKKDLISKIVKELEAS